MAEALQRCNGSFIKLNQTDNSTVDLVNQFGYQKIWTDVKKTVTGWKWLDGTMANVTCSRKYKIMLWGVYRILERGPNTPEG